MRVDWSNKYEVLDLVREGEYIKYASPELKDDKDFMLKICK